MATATVKKFPHDSNRIPRFQPVIHKSVVTLYRIIAIIVLYLLLTAILAYSFVMGFYAMDTSWVAPVILSASDDKSLDFTDKLVSSQQTLGDLTVDKQRMESSISEMKGHRASLVALKPQLQAAIARERTHNLAAGPQLRQLDLEKRTDNLKTGGVMAQVKEVETAIDKDLAAGLITKGDAATQHAALNQAESSYTDNRISEVLLSDAVLEKTTTDTKSLEVLDRQAELQSQITQLDIAIDVAEKQVREESQQIERLQQALATASQSPHYLSASGGTLYFAFVPYDNRNSVTAGAPIYDCYLNMVACRQVGTVKRIFSGEEHAVHPIFRTDMRGFLIQMELDRPESAKSKTVFLNRKPLFL